MFEGIISSGQTNKPNMGECLLLSRLPVELRLHIFEYVLSFERPLKLRQIVAGSKNTSILRTNRQIHQEALPIFYDFNTIMATRNDFCKDTDADLQTSLRKDLIRHLLIGNLSQSIKCSSYSGGNNMYLAGCCDVCKPNAAGFINALSNLPRLQTVVVDYHNHPREFAFIKENIRGIGSTHLDAYHGFTLTCSDIAQYKLTSPSLFPPSLSITFTDLPFHTIWTTISHHRAGANHVYAIPGEQEILGRLVADIDRDLPHQLLYFFCMRHATQMITLAHVKSTPMRDELDRALSEGSEGDVARAREKLTAELVRLGQNTGALNARLHLEAMRKMERHESVDWEAIERQLPAFPVPMPNLQGIGNSPIVVGVAP